ncbi:MAG: 50S ribosomal protein L11 methyltransferase [Magnetococcales bacterium]|nr:50S ribosomal protein L11 methyltransferase [Magnetococcales bacterium]
MWQLSIKPLSGNHHELLGQWLEQWQALAITVQDSGHRPVMIDGDFFDQYVLTALFDPDCDRQEIELRLRLLLVTLRPDLSEQPDLQWHLLADQDWQQSWQQHSSAIAIEDRLLVLPTWLDLPPEWQQRPVIRIDPQMAFGSGSHETTYGCLQQLAHAAQQQPLGTVLDVGTGSGILAIAALHLGATAVVATDCDEVAVATCLDNARLNGYRSVEEGGPLHCYQRADIPEGCFDVIVANLLAGIITDLLPTLVQALSPDGLLILSGLLIEQTQAIIDRCHQSGLQQVDREQLGDWVVLSARRRPL